MAKSSAEILKEIDDLIKYCYDDKAKRSVIIRRLQDLESELNGILPFD